MEIISTSRISAQEPRQGRGSNNHFVASSQFWRVVQYLLLLAGFGLVVALIYWPTIGLNTMWNGLIPLAPALLVIAPGLWRNICPMATFSLLPRRFGIARQRVISSRLAGWLGLIGLIVLFLIVPLRHLSLDTNGPLTALMLVISALVAFATGGLFAWRGGWCNSLCPIHPVERLYGQAPALTLPNARCDDCCRCSVPCPDSTRSMSPAVTGTTFIEKLSGHILTGSLVGFIWGWNRLPDYCEALTLKDIVTCYALPFGGALISLVVYTTILRWRCSSKAEQRTLVKYFAAAAVSMYYWYRIPALAGFGPHPGTGMIFDLTQNLPDLPLVSHIVTTSFFIWFMLLRKETGTSWTSRPLRRMGDEPATDCA